MATEEGIRVIMGLVALIGEQGIDWQYYVNEHTFWRKWVELNRN